MPNVSVIIPCHNHEAYVPDALRSVLTQTRPPDQVIVVDDGSTDGSAAAVDRFHDSVLLARQPRKGASAARNAGLAFASGDLIAFIDADDLWPADSLEVRLDRMEAEPHADCVFGMVEQFVSPEMPADEAARFRVPAAAALGRHAGAMLIRRSVFDRVGGFDPAIRIGELIDFAGRLAQDCCVTASIDHVVMRRRIHGDNMMIKNRGQYGEYLKVLRDHLNRRAAIPPEVG